MRTEHVDELVDDLTACRPTTADAILAAWNANEDLLARTHPNREEILRPLHQFTAAMPDPSSTRLLHAPEPRHRALSQEASLPYWPAAR